jgi:hypothetical protein
MAVKGHFGGEVTAAFNTIVSGHYSTNVMPLVSHSIKAIRSMREGTCLESCCSVEVLKQLSIVISAWSKRSLQQRDEEGRRSIVIAA